MLRVIIQTVTEWSPLDQWNVIDTWIVIIAGLAAMACALPGVFLVLRRQSMMGDALSHTSLLGIVLSLLFVNSCYRWGWISLEAMQALEPLAIVIGAIIVGVLTSWAAEWIRGYGRVESSAALGVVFTSLFALSLLLIRLKAGDAHIDEKCVLYGVVETSVMQTFFGKGLLGLSNSGSGIPVAAIANLSVLMLNIVLLLLFYKELKISSFDPDLATSLGINASLMNNLLMAVTAISLVTAFKSVGSILVIAMLVVPAATASLMSNRLHWVVLWSLVIAWLTALLGHSFALTLPPLIFSYMKNSSEFNASTAGMMAVTAGLLFTTAMLFAPRYGLLSRVIERFRLTLKIVGEDLIGLLYRIDEQSKQYQPAEVPALVSRMTGVSSFMTTLATIRLRVLGLISSGAEGYMLTVSGKQTAQEIVRSHRLWESYMAEHFELSESHLHETASAVEHYLTPEIRKELSETLPQTSTDPHGRIIPPEEGEEESQSSD